MESRGIGSVTDLIFFALIVAIACTFLIYSTPSSEEGGYTRFSERLGQNILLSFQRVPARSFEGLSYSTSGLPAISSSKIKLGDKTISQLIVEDIMLNSEIDGKEGVFRLERNNEFGDQVRDLLKRCLDKLTLGRFDYRLIVNLKSVRLPDDRNLCYRKVIESDVGFTRRLCSETVELNFFVPPRWRGEAPETLPKEGIDLSNLGSCSIREFIDISEEGFQSSPDSKLDRTAEITLTLELWSP